VRKVEIGDAIGKVERQVTVIEDDELEEGWGIICDGFPAPADPAEGDCSESVRVGAPSEDVNQQLRREAFHAQVRSEDYQLSINCHTSLYHDSIT
jgi:hypothetical protein